MKTLITIILFLLPITFIHSQTEWFKYQGNPVISGTSGTWDAAYVSFSTVIHDTVYKMWYTGGVNWNNFSDTKIGYATSIDGINWEKHPDPVITKGETGKFDEGMTACASVLYDEGIYKMWYIGTHSNVTDNWRIGFATSPDGINWTRQNDGNPVLDLGSAGEWDDQYVGHPTIIRDGSLLKMWFRGSRTPGNSGSIGLATSTDGINWTKYNDLSTQDSPYSESDPVLTGTTDSWDALVVWQPNVKLNNSTYEMWYVAQGTIFGQNLGYTTSSDGINWNKFTSNPVMSIGNPGNFDNPGLLAPSVIFGSDQIYRMWYTGNNSSTWRIGFAATDPSALVVDIKDEETSPNRFKLFQNYPNPFNPKTSIEYRIASSEYLTLKVYDLLGREVATLVDEFKPAGSYEVEFNASSLSSGTYFYRLHAGEFAATKKFILMK